MCENTPMLQVKSLQNGESAYPCGLGRLDRPQNGRRTPQRASQDISNSLGSVSLNAHRDQWVWGSLPRYSWARECLCYGHPSDLLHVLGLKVLLDTLGDAVDAELTKKVEMRARGRIMVVEQRTKEPMAKE
ncbi:6331_t:CDS:2, partial [Acaulospora colombiana]